VNVTWNDATKFCEWAGAVTKRGVGLPTEAEWEYACRAGTKTVYFTGDKEETLMGSANVADRKYRLKLRTYAPADFDDGYTFTSPEGSFHPNPFGLYDMVGNAQEWCEDYWDDQYDGKSTKKDPVNTNESPDHVLRGGSWALPPVFGRSYYRSLLEPATTNCWTGFRVMFRAD